MNPKLKNALEWTYCILIAIIIALAVKFFIGTPTVVKQTSMNNTLVEGQRLWLNRWVRTIEGEYRIGDIITFEAPSQVSLPLAKINFDYPVAIYDNEPKGLWDKFVYYVLETSKTSYIKRIIGVEGDHIKIENGKVYRNGEELNEEYLADGIETTSKVFSDIIVPEDCVFVMGDNRPHSTDSRDFGCIPVSKIESRVAFRFWPISEFGKIE